MQDGPTVTALAQKVSFDGDADLMILDHFWIMRRTAKGFQPVALSIRGVGYATR